MDESKQEKEVRELEDLSADIDGVVVSMFTTLRELFTARNQLELVMKDGYLNMAKARYEMGQNHAVSKLQYCEQDLCSALYHINITDYNTASSTVASSVYDEDQSVSCLQFLPLTDETPHHSQPFPSTSHQPSCQHRQVSDLKTHDADSHDNSVEEIPPSSVDILELGVGLRKRARGTNEEGNDDKSETQSDGSHRHSNDDSIDVDKSKDNVHQSVDAEDQRKSSGSSINDEDDISASLLGEQRQQSDITNNDPVETKSTDDSKAVHKDPLRWFGVLVPRSLRGSQRSFKQAIEISCEVATLQSQLAAHRARYGQLMRIKAELSRGIDKQGGGSKTEKPSEAEPIAA